MCGIVGIFRKEDKPPIEASLLKGMRDCMVHRGPDASGLYLDESGRVGLAHRRLSIIDLSEAAAQPMCDESGRLWVTFNGEIYNHLKLRDQLNKDGHRFKTDHSDTEVLLHGYRQWGMEGLLTRLKGMFGFAIWDQDQQWLWIARDRIGIKPVYFAWAGDDFIFASEIKALLRHPGVTRDINPVAASHYLSFWQTPAPLTMFAGIYKMPAGHMMFMDSRGQSRFSQYWDAVPPPGLLPEDIDQWPQGRQERFYVEGTMQRLRASVGEHMMSDVPYGAFLSGGIDSTTNVALMKEFTDRPVNTFTVGFSDFTHLNELEHAERIAKHYGTNHHQVLIDQSDMRGYLDQLVYSQDEPIADWVCIPLYFVSKLARDNGVIVIQVGEGSDEQFSGYTGYMNYLMAHKTFWRPFHRYVPPPLRRLAAPPLSLACRLRPGMAHRLDLLERGARGREIFWSNCHIFTDNIKRQFYRGQRAADRFSQDMPCLDRVASAAQRDWDTYHLVRELLDSLREKNPGADLLDRMIYLEFKLRLAELLLMRVDKITMSVSLEARVPYLDHELVEFSSAIPTRWKIHNGQTKHILKQAVRGLVPDWVIDRPKVGFGAPMQQWMRPGSFLDHVESVVMGSSLRQRGLFNYGRIKNLIEAQRSRSQQNGAYIWTLYNLSAWYDRWIAG